MKNIFPVSESYIFKTQQRPVGENATLGNRTREPAYLVQSCANFATKTDAKSLPTSTVQ